MSVNERDRILLQELLDLIDLTRDKAPDDKQAFLNDLNARDATALRIQAIGEHLQALSQEFREKHPELPWHQSIAMRNIIAHEYGNLDFEIVWEVVKGSDFDEFRDQIVSILGE